MATLLFLSLGVYENERTNTVQICSCRMNIFKPFKCTSECDTGRPLHPNDNLKCRYVQVVERLIFTSSSYEQIKSLLPPWIRKAHFIPENRLHLEDGTEVALNPAGLASMYRFSILLSNTTRRLQDKTIVVCGGRTKRSITYAALLMGSYLILCHQHDPESVESAMRPVSSAFVVFTDNIALIDCWRALAHVR
jgi:hypothetical protein